MDIKPENQKENQNQVLLDKIINLIPPNEQEELKQKVEKFTALMNLPSNSTQAQPVKKTKNKLNKYDTSNETLLLNPESIESLEETNNQSKKNLGIKVEDKNTSEHISLLEDEEEKEKEKEKEKDIEKEKELGENSNKSIKDKDKEKEKKDAKSSNKYVGKKRKLTDIPKIIEEINNRNQAKTQKNKYKYKSDDENSKFSQIQLFTKKKREKRNIPEKELLLELVKKEGFMKVFNCLTIIPLNRKNQLEKQMDDIILSIGLLRTSLILFQIKFKNENFSSSIMNINNNESNNISSPNNSDLEDEDIEIVIDGVDGGEKREKKNKNLNKTYLKKNNSTILKNTIDELKETFSKPKYEEKEPTVEELSIHLHKDKDGKIYKYNKNYIRDSNNIVAYYCADRRCSGKGNYYFDTMKFEINKDHDMLHEEHNYVKNKERADKFRQIIKEFQKRNCHEAQVFKRENGSQIAKWYD